MGTTSREIRRIKNVFIDDCKFDNMVVILNRITLADNVIDRMKTLLKETKKHNLEYGFDICRKNDNLIMRNECHGTICSIELPRGCELDEKLVGDYHTHPRGTSLLSSSDMHVACKLDFSCIGSRYKKHENIICHVKRPNVNVSDCREDAIEKGADIMADKYFKKINIL